MAFLPTENIISTKRTIDYDTGKEYITDIIEKVFYERRDGKYVRVTQEIERVTARNYVTINNIVVPESTSKTHRQGNAPAAGAASSRWALKANTLASTGKIKDESTSSGSGSFAGKIMSSGFSTGRSRQADEHLYTVFLDNLPELSKDDIFSLVLSASGLDRSHIKRVNVVLDKYTGAPRDMAFVVMDTIEHAKHVIDCLNGKDICHAIIGAQNAKPRRSD